LAHRLDSATAVHRDIAWRCITTLLGTLLVILDQWARLLVIDSQALPNRLLPVIFSLNQRFTGHIVFASFYWRGIIDVVNTSGSRVTAASGHSRYDVLVVDLNFDNRINYHTSVLQGIGLGNRARKPVEEKSLGTVRLCNPFTHKADNDVIGHQLASIHNGFGGASKLRTSLDGGSEHIACGNLWDPVGFTQGDGLRAFTCPRWA